MIRKCNRRLKSTKDQVNRFIKNGSKGTTLLQLKTKYLSILRRTQDRVAEWFKALDC